MTTLAATLGLTSVPLKQGQTFGSHQVSLTKDGLAYGTPVTTQNPSATFANLPTGNYVATAVSVDTTGAPISPPVSAPSIYVPATVGAVTSITVALQ